MLSCGVLVLDTGLRTDLNPSGTPEGQSLKCPVYERQDSTESHSCLRCITACRSVVPVYKQRGWNACQSGNPPCGYNFLLFVCPIAWLPTELQTTSSVASLVFLTCLRRNKMVLLCWKWCHGVRHTSLCKRTVAKSVITVCVTGDGVCGWWVYQWSRPV